MLKKNIIADISYFKDFNIDEINIITKHSSLISFNAGDFLVKTNQPAENFYFILKGTVSLQVLSNENGIIELSSVSENEFLCWSWLSSPYKYTLNAVAFEKTATLMIDAVGIKREMEDNHEFGNKIYQIFSKTIIEQFQGLQKSFVELYENSF